MTQARQASFYKPVLKLILSQDFSKEVVIPISLKEFPQRVSFFVKETLITSNPVRCQQKQNVGEPIYYTTLRLAALANIMESFVQETIR